jgi:hypothetical protein
MFFSISQGQDSTLSRSKYELFALKAGVLYLNEEVPAGSIKKIQLVARRLTNVETKESVKAIVISEKLGSFFGPLTYGDLYVDFEDLDAVIKTLTLYKEIIKEKQPKNKPTYTFSSNNDVSITCTWSDGTYLNEWQVLMSRRYKYSKALIMGSVIGLRNKDLDEIIGLLTTAKDVSFRK